MILVFGEREAKPMGYAHAPKLPASTERLVDQSALDRMERRIYADPNLLRIRRCTVEHPSAPSSECQTAVDTLPEVCGR
mgnify:CR=1 FL=1|jgi:hypothetical protein